MDTIKNNIYDFTLFFDVISNVQDNSCKYESCFIK